MTRNVTDLSSRRRCSQPEIITCSPTSAGRSAARTREIITLLAGLRDPLGVRARRELAVPPLFRRRRPDQRRPRSGPVTGAGRQGIGHAAGRGGRSSPRSGGSSRRAAGPPSQLPAALWPPAVLRATCLRQRVAASLAGRAGHPASELPCTGVPSPE